MNMHEQVLSMASRSREKSKEKQKEAFTAKIVRQSRTVERLLEAEYGFLPEDHRVTKFAQASIDDIFPDEALRVRVTTNAGEPNALSLAHGTVVITRGMLKLLDTTDELKIVQGHEGVHYKEGHVDEINETVDASRKKFETSDLGGQLQMATKVLGVKRFAEYEADIRGILAATAGKANPGAARSMFQKLDAYSKKQRHRSGTTHGQTIERIINLGIVGQLTDFQSSTVPEVPLPDFVKAFAQEKADEPLPQQFRGGKMTAELKEAIKTESLANLTFALHELHRSVTELDVVEETKRGVEAQTKKRYVGSERHSDLFLATINEIQNRLKTIVPKADDQQRSVLLHALLEISVGLRTDEVPERIAAFMTPFEDIEDADEMASAVSILRPDVFERVGAIILDPQDVRAYGDVVLRSMNESEIFINDEGAFDDAAYLKEAGALAGRLKDIFLENGLGEEEDVSLVESVMREGLLNLNLRKDTKPLFVFIKSLQSSWKDQALKPHPDEIMFEIHKQKRLKLTPAQEQELVELLMSSNQFYPVLHSIQSDAELRRKFGGVHPDDLFTDRRLDDDDEWMSEKGKEQEKDKRNARTEAQLAARSAAMDLFHQANCNSLQDLKLFLQEVHELGTEFIMSDAGSREKFAKEGERGVRERLTQDSNAVDRLTSAMTFNRGDIGITATCDALIPCLMRGLIEQGASFLPEKKSDRAKALLAFMFSGSRELKEWSFILLKDYDDGTFAAEEEKTGVGSVNNMIEVLHVLSGDHPAYSENDLPKPKFSPSKAPSMQGLTFEDHEFMAVGLRGSFESLELAIRSGSINDKRVVAESIAAIIRWQFRYVDDGTWLETFSEADDERYDAERYVLKSLLDTVFKQFEFDLNDMQDQELLLMCSGLSSDFILRARTQDEILRRRGERSDFTAQLNLLFREPVTRYSMTKELKEEFIEKRAQTFDEIQQVADALQESVSTLTDPEYMGAVVIMQELTGAFKDKWESLKMLLNLGETDEDWKQILFEQARRSGTDEEALLKVDRWLERVTHANDMVKYLLLRDILVGKKGILLEEDSRRKLFDHLFSKHIRVEGADQTRLLRIIEEVKDVMVGVAEPDLLFFAIAPLLHERILKSPKKSYPWSKILHSIYGDKDVVKTTIEGSNKLAKGEAIEVETGYGKEIIRPGLADIYTEKITSLLDASGREAGPQQERTSHWSVDEFILKVAQNLGSPGTRFLQVLGQYVDLPDRLYEKFKDVYDNVKSQSKITATSTIKREWPEHREALDGLEERIGGGSLMTAYRGRRHEGSETGADGEKHEMVKVLSPNAELQLKVSIDFIHLVLSHLVEKNRERYEPAQTAMKDIEKWIREDIHYQGFLEKDKEFKARYEGACLPGGRYKLHIPDSYGVGREERDNIYVKREEFVEGVTYNKLESTDSGHDRKEIVALVCQNFIQQVFDGRVHSNIHPGNIMISTDRNGQDSVAIIDRNYFIDLTPQDQRLIQSLYQAGEDLDFMMREVLHYLHESGGGKIEEVHAQRVKQACAKVWSEATTPTSRLSRVLLVLKKERLKIPLFVTLLANNVISLNSMSKRAGFASLEEAMTYAP